MDTEAEKDAGFDRRYDEIAAKYPGLAPRHIGMAVRADLMAEEDRKAEDERWRHLGREFGRGVVEGVRGARRK